MAEILEQIKSRILWWMKVWVIKSADIDFFFLVVKPHTVQHLGRKILHLTNTFIEGQQESKKKEKTPKILLASMIEDSCAY